jgi:DNA/RNA endonuclease YhcR with UshA esterase domain
MTRLLQGRVGMVWLAGVLLFSTTAGAQQTAQTAAQRNQAYDVSRETVVEGKVLQYTAASSVAPLGPHVTVQTSLGVVDVHLGSARLLEANHFSLNSGDSVRIVGENVAYGKGSQFLARVIQKGTQVLAVRSARGLPLAPSGKFGPQTGGGAL